MAFDNLGIGHRLLWAEAIDNDRTAIVIQYGGQFIGGIAQLQAFEICSWGYFASRRPTTMELKFIFEWYRVVDSVDEFRRSKEWQKPTPRFEAVKVKLIPKDPEKYKQGFDTLYAQLVPGDAEVLRIASSKENQNERKFYGPGCDDTGKVNYDLPPR